MNTTANCLIELGTEELPPTALKALSAAFEQGLLAGLRAADLNFNADEVKSFATPRRLAIFIPELQTQQPDKNIEKLGPAVAAAYDKEGKPSKAAEGFARSNGVSFDDLITIETDKGERLGFRSLAKGKAAAELLEGLITASLDALPIPKRMRWGASRSEFVRPVQWLVALLDSEVVECNVLGITSGQQSFGHRFHAPDPITIDNALNYESLLLEKGHITADFNKRRDAIAAQVSALGKQVNGHTVIEDELLDEVTALVEQPFALMGKFDSEFLSVPQEALIYSMSEHQKYFHIVDDAGNLLPNFITVSNINSIDADKVISGNERVIRPRLADAAFFFETDKKLSLASLRERLKTIVFQKQLGTIFEKTERIGSLAEGLATALKADADAAKLAGQLCKADLASDMVLEFDKMQGTAGGYYATNEGLSDEVANAIKSHYLPKFAGDIVPQSNTACAVALADRLDTLTGIFGIGQEPSGSKDPFALRRASIGILQIILQNDLTLNIDEWISRATAQHAAVKDPEATTARVVDYLFDRFAAVYQDQGLPVEVFTAVKANIISSPLDFNARVQAVAAFIKTSESESLASANKRVSNILEKSDGTVNAADFNATLLVEAAEKDLAAAINEKEAQVKPLFAQGNYRDGLLKLTELKDSVDAFFDGVMVNADDPTLKSNRLALLSRLRALFLQVADISVLAPQKR
ncbi:MAG: glycine--tRNA ligase subunit beta [Pseudomonadales bacterium]|nr:glycine--tRNA ligase subunit beta [Pseudomonadales bacterium]